MGIVDRLQEEAAEIDEALSRLPAESALRRHLLQRRSEIDAAIGDAKSLGPGSTESEGATDFVGFQSATSGTEAVAAQSGRRAWYLLALGAALAIAGGVWWLGSGVDAPTSEDTETSELAGSEEPDDDGQALVEEICAAALAEQYTNDAQRVIGQQVRAADVDMTEASLRSRIHTECNDQVQALGSPAPPQPTFHDPQPEDFQLAVNVLEQRCFGSAGCNVSFRMDLAYTNSQELDPDKTYEVTYEIRGGDDVLINTLTVEGTSFWTDDRERIGTPSSTTNLTAVVRSVSER